MAEAIADPRTDEKPTLDLTPRQKLIVMLAVLLGLFLSALDQTIVGTALPRIVSDLHGNELYTWVVTAYLLTATITVPIYGKLGDVFGRKAMMITGIGIFLLGSALCGLSGLFRTSDVNNQTGMSLLIAFRAFQGLGAGALFPISLAVIGDLFTARERGRYQGLFGAVFGVSFLIGPFLGGFITDTIGWPWVFYVNLPVGLVALAVIQRVLPNVRTVSAKLADLDYAGVAVFTLGVVPLLLGLTYKGLIAPGTGELYDWLSFNVLGLVGIGLLILVGFLFIEARAKHAIIPLDLFRDRTIVISNLAVFMVSCAMFSAIIFLPRYFQFTEGISATGSGYATWPLLFGLIGSSVGAGIVVSRTGRYRLMLTAAMAMLLLGVFLMTHLKAGTPTPLLWLWMACVGLGIGPSLSTFTVVIQNVAPRRQLGTATSTMTFLRQIGGSVGLAVAGSLFSQSFTAKIPDQLRAAGVPDRLISSATKTSFGQNDASVGVDLGQQILNNAPPAARGILAPYIHGFVEGLHKAFALAVGDTFWVAVVAAALALLATLFIREGPLRGVHSPAAAEPSQVATQDEPVAAPAI